MHLPTGLFQNNTPPGRMQVRNQCCQPTNQRPEITALAVAMAVTAYVIVRLLKFLLVARKSVFSYHFINPYTAVGLIILTHN